MATLGGTWRLSVGIVVAVSPVVKMLLRLLLDCQKNDDKGSCETDARDRRKMVHKDRVDREGMEIERAQWLHRESVTDEQACVVR